MSGDERGGRSDRLPCLTLTSLNLPNGRMEPIDQTDRLRMATARLWLGYKQKRPLESGRLLLARTAILLVAREGFEPPTFGL